MTDTYTCEACGGTFPKGQTDVETEAQYANLFQELTPEQRADRALVCTPCYDEIMEARKAAQEMN